MLKVKEIQELINRFELDYTYDRGFNGEVYNSKEKLIKDILQGLLDLIEKESE